MRQTAYNWLRSGYARGWQPADWEDMAQDAVLKAITEIAQGRVDPSRFGPTGFEAWFKVVVQRIAIDRRRTRLGRKGEREFLPGERVEALEDERTEAQLNHILAKLDIQALLEDPTLLLEHERAVLALTYWHGLSSHEIAAVLGVDSGSTVRTWLRNALRKLREHYGEGQETSRTSFPFAKNLLCPISPLLRLRYALACRSRVPYPLKRLQGLDV